MPPRIPRCLIATISLAAMIVAETGCTRAGGAPERELSSDTRGERSNGVDSTRRTSRTDNARPGDLVERLERLRTTGRFEEFVDGALNAGEADDAALEVLKGEALLATGRPAECEASALRLMTRLRGAAEPNVLAQAVKLWTTARFRQGKSLDDPTVRDTLARGLEGDASVESLRYWRDVLGGRATYRLEPSGKERIKLMPADADRGSVAFELAAVKARVNGTTMPRVFIDSGAQFTLMTAEAARSAGVDVGARGMQLVGFAGVKAQPGLIETLELGELVLHDVPVAVGDSAPLSASGGQMSLGTEMMQHVRFHIDYPARRVTAEPANGAVTQAGRPAIWEIPVWTFSQVCLARGQLGAGPMARALVDTGNRAGTFVSYRWARRNMPGLGGTSSLVFRLKKRKMTLDMFDLGSQSLANWPVADTLPLDLDRLNLVDVILGHDLLWPYELTIDLPRRVLELRPGTSPADGARGVAGNDEDKK